MPSVFLYAPQDFHNLCLLVRTLEAFGYGECAVFDPHHIVRERYGKVRTREMRAVSAGAFEKVSWTRVDEPAEFIGEHRGRVVATVPTVGATPISAYRFEATDMIVFGAESDGLPSEILTVCDSSVTIPLSGRTKSLNLAVSVGIVLFEVQRQQGG